MTIEFSPVICKLLKCSMVGIARSAKGIVSACEGCIALLESLEHDSRNGDKGEGEDR